MFVLVLFFLALVPLVELALLIQLYRATDLLTTLAYVIGTGIVGAALARRQGFEIWRRIRSQMAEGEPPAKELVDALMVVIAGGLLILPGILTDIVGVLLLLPPVRAVLRGWLVRRMVPPGAATIYSFTTGSFPEMRKRDNNEIEAEYTVEPGDPPSDPRLPKPTE